MGVHVYDFDLLEHALVRVFGGSGRGGIKRFSCTLEPDVFCVGAGKAN